MISLSRVFADVLQNFISVTTDVFINLQKQISFIYRHKLRVYRIFLLSLEDSHLIH